MSWMRQAPRAQFIAVAMLWAASSGDVQAASGVDRAYERFKAHCEQAGEKIIRTVENVDGLFLIKVRGKTNVDEQFVFDDPYGREAPGKGYIEGFLQEKYQVNKLIQQRWPSPGAKPNSEVGYRFVETIDPVDGVRYRYSGVIEQPGLTNPHYIKDYWRLGLVRTPSTGPMPRYGVTFEDISTKEDRSYWIAGGSLKVIDMQSNEVIAERIGYMMDPGRGDRRGGRSPWLFATNMSCPQFRGHPGANDQLGQADRFVEKVLHPR